MKLGEKVTSGVTTYPSELRGKGGLIFKRYIKKNKNNSCKKKDSIWQKEALGAFAVFLWYLVRIKKIIIWNVFKICFVLQTKIAEQFMLITYILSILFKKYIFFIFIKFMDCPTWNPSWQNVRPPPQYHCTIYPRVPSHGRIRDGFEYDGWQHPANKNLTLERYSKKVLYLKPSR